jgi:tetratricopeptide (TPR) repeat protein
MAAHCPINASNPPAGRNRFWFGLSNADPTIIICTSLFLLVLWTFCPALNNEFVNYDDAIYVTANPHVQQGLTWGNLKWAFQPSTGTANWHPLTWLSHMLDCQCFGLNPAGHHLTSVLVHAANTVILFLVLRYLTRTVWRSLCVAALFGLHPLHVESVAWVAERKDVLSTLFWLLTIWAYGKFVRESGSPGGTPNRFYALALVLFSLGLMSKAMLVTLPFVLLLLDYWPLARFRQIGLRALAVEKIPFLLLAMAACAITFAVQKSAGAVAPMAPLPLQARLANAAVSYCRYLGKTVWPENLAVFYPHPVHWPAWEISFAVASLAAATLFVFKMRRIAPYLPVGWLWFVGTLVPVIGLVQVGAQAMADRYSYIPLVGVFVLMTWGAHHLLQREPHRVILLSATAVAAILPCIALTRQQIGNWRNSGTLFQHAAAVTRNNYVAYLHLGNFLGGENRPGQAIDAYRRAIQIYPRYADARLNLGVLLRLEGSDESVKQLEVVILLQPGNAEAHGQLGLEWLDKGAFEKAVDQFRQCLKINPADAEAHNNLGVALGREGHWDEAIGQLRAAIFLTPNYAKAHGNLGIVLAARGYREEAIVQLDKALKLQPDYPEASQCLQHLTASEKL